jgi:hypothetical protein
MSASRFEEGLHVPRGGVPVQGTRVPYPSERSREGAWSYPTTGSSRPRWRGERRGRRREGNLLASERGGPKTPTPYERQAPAWFAPVGALRWPARARHAGCPRRSSDFRRKRRRRSSSWKALPRRNGSGSRLILARARLVQGHRLALPDLRLAAERFAQVAHRGMGRRKLIEAQGRDSSIANPKSHARATTVGRWIPRM